MFLKNLGCTGLIGATTFGLALGTAGPGEAKNKKDAAPSPGIVVCTQFTYRSECFTNQTPVFYLGLPGLGVVPGTNVTNEAKGKKNKVKGKKKTRSES